VNLKRNSLGIAAFGHVAWTPEMLAALGQESDASLATQWGISKASVVAKRGSLGIAPLDSSRGKHSQHSWQPNEVVLLGTASDADVATQLGLTVAAVRNARMARGIAPARPQKPPIAKS
jgi:electron transfer flavoprotein alpha/beta subunit